MATAGAALLQKTPYEREARLLQALCPWSIHGIDAARPRSGR